MSAHSEAADGFVIAGSLIPVLDALSPDLRNNVITTAFNIFNGFEVGAVEPQVMAIAGVVSDKAIEIRTSLRKRQEQSKNARALGISRNSETIVRPSHDTAKRKEENPSPTPLSYKKKGETKPDTTTPPTPSQGEVTRKKEDKRFVKPTLDEVRQYLVERDKFAEEHHLVKVSIDAQQFIDYYEVKGWRVGNNPMKDWKAAIRLWESKRRNYGLRFGTEQGRYGSARGGGQRAGNVRPGSDAQRAETATVL